MLESRRNSELQNPDSDGGNWSSFVAVIDGPANVCGSVYCCLSSTVICELFDFLQGYYPPQLFNSAVYAHWLSFEPDVVIQSSVCFDTEVEKT